MTGEDTVQEGYWPLQDGVGEDTSRSERRDSSEDSARVRGIRREFRRQTREPLPNPLPPDIIIRDFAIHPQDLQMGSCVSTEGGNQAVNEAGESAGRPEPATGQPSSERLDDAGIESSCFCIIRLSTECCKRIREMLGSIRLRKGCVSDSFDEDAGADGWEEAVLREEAVLF